MSNGGFLDGAYWFEFYTILSAILALVLPILDREHDLDAYELLKKVRAGRETLARQAHRSSTAARCSQILTVRFYKPLNIEFVLTIPLACV
jgi:hypothetical protein